MKLLIITQVVDRTDPVLGFFHRWIEELAPRYETISVICLREGDHTLPENVRVYSLGKESGESRIKYVTRFYSYVWKLRKEYDAVFVHMNQEYVLLAGLLWKLMGKRVYMWRNFHKGTFLTDAAAFWCTKVFCTSASSYTAKYKKTILMPVGVDTEVFSFATVSPKEHSILSLGRIAEEKRLELLVDAGAMLTQVTTPEVVIDIYGNALPKDAEYAQTLQARAKEKAAASIVQFHPGIANDHTPEVYRAHEVFVNISPSGMYDKTIFEAAASGCLVLASSDDWKGIADPRLGFDPSAESLAAALEGILMLPAEEKQQLRAQLREITIEKHSLTALGEQLSAAIY